MKILVLSDSHSSLHFMRQCLTVFKPDCMIHLGDYYDDAQTMVEEFPNIPLIQVPGNCDEYRALAKAPRILQPTIDGVRFYLTHGHLHHVKMTNAALIRDAKQCGSQIVLYGHTHIPECIQEEGMWVMNPGSCGYHGGSAGLIELSNGVILTCKNIFPEDLEALK